MNKSPAGPMAHLFGRLALGLAALMPLAVTQAQPSAARDALQITSMTPSGSNVPPGRQIVIQFNRPAVPIGRMARDDDEVAISIEPALDCDWRWIDPSALACQLADGAAFAPATRYALTVGAAFAADDGASLGTPYERVFETERPRIAFVSFANWQGPGTPVMRLVFNQPVTADSVAEHVFLTTAANVRLSLQIEADQNDRELPRFVPLPGERAIVDFGAPQTQPNEDESEGRGAGEARRIWLARPIDPIAADTNVELRVEPGLRSAEGPLQGDETRTVVTFDTFPEYRFSGISCFDNAGNALTLDVDELALTLPAAAASVRSCNPMQRIGLSFTAPTIATEIRDHIALIPDLAGGRTDYDPWANAPRYSSLRSPHEQGRRYVVWLPERLQADQSYRLSTAAGVEGPRDEFGRSLPAPIDIAFTTDHRPPDFTIAHPFAVLESEVDSEVPLYVTNLDSASFRYRRVTADDDASLTRGLTLSEVEDIQYGLPFGVREMLDAGSGVVFGRLATVPAVGKSTAARTLFAEVTPYQVHIKLGHFNSLAWVTKLATGEPVRDARIAVYVDRIETITAAFDPLAEAATDRNGLALLPGTAALDPDLALSRSYCGPDFHACRRLFVRVEHDGEIAILPLDPRFEIDSYRVSNYQVFSSNRPQFGHLASWGTTAQGVYRSGDTIDYKIYVRDQSNDHYVPAPKGPYRLEIRDPTGQAVHSVAAIELSEFGAFDGRFELPDNATVGWYQFVLEAGFAEQTRVPMQVLVSDFTPSSFRVSVSLDGDRYVAGDPLAVEAMASLFSGGAYRDAEARIDVSLRAREFAPEHPLAAGFRFGAERTRPTVQVAQDNGALDAAGTIERRFTLPADLGDYQTFSTLRVEAAVRDDRGRYIAQTATAEVLAVDRIVGLRNTSWTYSEDEPAIIESIVVDGAGTPVAGTAAAILIERLETRATRVRGAGNAFLTEYVDDWVEAGSCDSVSTAAAMPCQFVPADPGRYRVTAEIADTAGRRHSTTIFAWVRGKGQVIWNTGNDDALEVIPEQPRYEVGDTARYLVQNPYPGARALITIERYGVLDQWVETFETSTPVVEFEVEPDFLPGFFLSIVLMSPRVEAPAPALGELDLGKPAFKMAYLSVPVADPYKQLTIDVSTDAPSYGPRDKVSVDIRAQALNRDSAEPIEVAVVVLDEAVLDLIQGGSAYFDPYEGFNGLDGLDVRNYSLLTRLVGRQRIELKGANPGGDGGAALSMRSLFRFVAYWNPSLELDRRGRGSFDFELPDNLTGWRVLVLGTTPTDRMGLGDTEFTVTLPTEIRPLMPNQLTEGDRFSAGASVTNRTDQARDIAVTILAEGDLVAPARYTETLQLAPFERGRVQVPLSAARLPLSRERTPGEIRFSISAGDAIDSDALAHAVPVRKQRILQTAASFGTLSGESAAEALAFPGTLMPDAGEVGVELFPSVIGNVDGAFRAARDNDYLFWEQMLTKAVMASHYQVLEDYVTPTFSWEESGTLPAAILAQAASYQAPNGGMSYLIPENEYVSPYLSAYTALAFAWLARDGHEVPAVVEQRLLGYLDNLLRRDVMPDFYDRGMSSTVRAAGLAALALRGRLTAADLSRFREHVDYMSLFGKAHYLIAAANVPGGEPTAAAVAEALLQASVRSAGKLSFNERLDDGYTRILSTPMRTQCAVLSALLASPDSFDQASAFALVRTITQSRGNRAHWENAQENVFCMNALIEYAARYETTTPSIDVRADIDGRELGTAQLASLTDAPVTLARPIEPADAGARRTLTIDMQGTGRVYYAARMSYADSADYGEPVNSGLDIRREYSVERDGAWVLLDEPALVRQGELVRVDLFLSLPTARQFVVVEDPVAGGLEPVNRDLANASVVDAEAGDFQAAGGSWWFQFDDWRHYGVSRWAFHHRELRHDLVRFYADYLPPGHYALSYTAQAIAAGTYTLMPVQANETYDPDVFGLSDAGSMEVEAE